MCFFTSSFLKTRDWIRSDPGLVEKHLQTFNFKTKNKFHSVIRIGPFTFVVGFESSRLALAIAPGRFVVRRFVPPPSSNLDGAHVQSGVLVLLGLTLDTTCVFLSVFSTFVCAILFFFSSIHHC